MPSVPSASDLTSHASSSSSSTPSVGTGQHSSSPPAPEMKDVSNATRVSRPSAYPKKKPSPYGVSKSSRRQSPLYPPHSLVRKTPRAAKAELIAQRQRYAQISALRREGIYLEEEYHEEIRAYMHEMEVSCASLKSFHSVAESCHLSRVAPDNVFDLVHGSTTRDPVAYAPVSGRLPRRAPLHVPPTS